MTAMQYSITPLFISTPAEDLLHFLEEKVRLGELLCWDSRHHGVIGNVHLRDWHFDLGIWNHAPAFGREELEILQFVEPGQCHLGGIGVWRALDQRGHMGKPG